MAFTTVTCTGTVTLGDGSVAPRATVRCTPTAAMTNGGTTLGTAPMIVISDVLGNFSINLPANDDAGTTPVGSSYLLEVIYGNSGFGSGLLSSRSVVVTAASAPTVGLFSLPRVISASSGANPGAATLYMPSPTSIAGIDGPAMKAVLDTANTAGGARVYYSGGVYQSAITLPLYSNVHQRGAGVRATVVKLANGANVDLFQTQNFATFTGGTDGNGPRNFSVSDMTLDGNQTSNTSGYGIRIYGSAYQLERLEIHEFAQKGLYSEWSEGNFHTPSFYWDNNTDIPQEEGRCRDLYIHHNTGGGIYHNGPHDSVFTDCHVVKNGPASASTTIGVDVDTQGVALHFNNVHVWGSTHKYSWVIKGASCMLDNCQADGPPAIILANGVIWRGGWTPSATTASSFQIGDNTTTFNGTTWTAADYHIDCKMKGSGINFAKDGGNGYIKVHCYWPDVTKQFFVGTAQANKPTIVDLTLTGDSDAAIAYDGYTAIPSGGALVTGLLRRTSTRQYADSRAGGTAHLPSGYKGQTASRLECANSLSISGAQLTSGTLLASGPIWLAPGDPISTISLIATVAGANMDHMWCCLLSLTGWNGTTGTWNVLASTGDTVGDRAAWTIDTHRDFAIATDGSGAAMTTYVAPIAGIKVWVGALVQGASSPALGLMGIPSSVGMKAGANELEPISINGPGALTTPASLVTPLSTSSTSSKLIWAGLK